VFFYLPQHGESDRQVEKHGTDEQCVNSGLPEEGDGVSARNVVFKPVNAADRPRRLYCMLLMGSNSNSPEFELR
jgi:hypothetical protein